MDSGGCLELLLLLKADMLEGQTEYFNQNRSAALLPSVSREGPRSRSRTDARIFPFQTTEPRAWGSQEPGWTERLRSERLMSASAGGHSWSGGAAGISSVSPELVQPVLRLRSLSSLVFNSVQVFWKKYQQDRMQLRITGEEVGGEAGRRRGEEAVGGGALS